ncbi:thioredoxin family protein [Notoacmeibacter ruber]|uniref:Co-chaperone YbbN n=1 Tax=Notoacmeibacter ruber TaxID=2670375 RepID=A0A3L7JHP3_9HYPH|nr:co-chaperone YbbN [Notoacmeibacter ruber]RLQ89141.1 co-chaperone YbbN [Notoacmeibacter ruber]
MSTGNGFLDLSGGENTGAGDNQIVDTTTASFAQDVIEPSKEVPVLVDFWAPWCGPCRQLGPLLEKVVRESKGAIRLVKMNIDEHPAIAGQLGVQSIPAVFAFVGGRPVDGFMGALPESEIKAFVDRLPKGEGAPADPVEQAMEMAREAENSGENERAMQVYAAILQRVPEHGEARVALAGLLWDAGEKEQATAMIADLPDDSDLEGLAMLKKRIALEEEVAALGDPDALFRRLETNPDDHQARCDLAAIENARGNRMEAADHLLEIIRRDRDWRDGEARTQLLTFFEAWGPKEPAVAKARRKLSSLLFA